MIFLLIISAPMNPINCNPHFSSIADRYPPASRGCAPAVEPT